MCRKSIYRKLWILSVSQKSDRLIINMPEMFGTSDDKSWLYLQTYQDFKNVILEVEKENSYVRLSLLITIWVMLWLSKQRTWAITPDTQEKNHRDPGTLRSSGGQGRWAGQTLRVAIDELVSIGDEILTAPLVISLRYRPPVRVVPDRLALKLPSLLCVILIIARTTILFACTSFCSAIFKFINTVMALDWLNAYQNWLVSVNKSSWS